MATPIEWHNIQGLLRRGYKDYKHARYDLLAIDDVDNAKSWYGEVVDKVSMSLEGEDQLHDYLEVDYRFNIAFTHDGLRQLGVQDGTLASFSAPFREGMVGIVRDGKSSRSARLGDVHKNRPNQWRWGGTAPGSDSIHILLLIFAKDIDAADAAFAKIVPDGDLVAAGLRNAETLSGFMDPDDPVEHFGFRDGISNPIIEDPAHKRSLSEIEHAISVVKPGEFIMGYENERDVISESPIVTDDEKGHDVLPPKGDNWDLGKNGTYLVFRQLRQDVRLFDEFLGEKHDEFLTTPNVSMRDWLPKDKDKWKKWLAAKMVGRWPNGMPLTRDPQEEPEKYLPEEANDFYFADNDQEGMRCPIGSHIRRANPRDSLDKDPAHALKVGKHRRIIRRGRLYGDPYDPEYPDDGTDDNERGLHFLCLNANIAGQFESIQHDWLNHPQFGELYEETDPLLGTRSTTGHLFTVPARPSNLRFEGIGQFVTVSGGAYFFLPGKQALDWLRTI